MPNNVSKYDPFAELRALQKQFFGDDWFTRMPNSIHLPTTDIYMRGDRMMVVETHLPKFSEKDVSVDIENGMLEIQAERHETYDEDDKKYMVRETSNSFYRRIRLPEQADADKIKAEIHGGLLTITIPFKKMPEPKRVTVLGDGRAKKSKSSAGSEAA
ncbi:MAG TPA: Hsp20/alpha crystallin family protein [Candidatus Saccharimonadales bacterium]|nr:Hsp20/alpha crystallin family protein [Candidatus Saccharimonadales bacterium]